ncbi:colicin immunity domain-containing protein [Streptomyces sp. NPDC012825]|uniref:colicin immunity domain-containing protein n=1 Tax=Streptomyces sp. NPDC012825 TaxID=3364851 RepID=UPI003673DFAE
MTFLSAAVNEGVDAARAQFGRYARAAKGRWPNLPKIASSYPPTHRAWSNPADVTPGTATSRLVALFDAFVRGTCTAAEFADGWWETQRNAQSQGERATGGLADLLGEVFMLLEDYTPDPELRETGDLTDSELRERVLNLAKNSGWQPKRK